MVLTIYLIGLAITEMVSGTSTLIQKTKKQDLETSFWK